MSEHDNGLCPGDISVNDLFEDLGCQTATAHSMPPGPDLRP